MPDIFTEHEILVLSTALSKIHSIYSYPERNNSNDKICAKAIRIVFRRKYPTLASHPSIMVTFNNLMYLFPIDTKRHLVSWYIDTQAIEPPEDGAHEENIRDFTTDLTVISIILHWNPPETCGNDMQQIQNKLNQYWRRIVREIS